MAKWHALAAKRARSQWNRIGPHKPRVRISDGVIRALVNSQLPNDKEAYTQRLQELLEEENASNE